MRGAAGAVKDLQKRQKSRTSRGIRDVLDHALIDLAAWYRDVLAMQVGADVEAIHDDQRTAMETAARGTRPEQTLARIEAVLAAPAIAHRVHRRRARSSRSSRSPCSCSSRPADPAAGNARAKLPRRRCMR